MAALLDEVMRSKRPGEAGLASQEANTMQLMQTIKAQPGASASQLGAAMASSAGQEQLKQTQAVVQEQAGALEQGVAREKQVAIEQASQKDIAYRRLAEKNTQRLYTLDKDAAQQIAVASRQFKVDEAGRKYLNSEMLDQYMVAKARSEEELKDYVNQTELMYNRKAQLLDTYAKQLETIAMRGFITEQQDLDQKSKETLTNIAARFRIEAQDALKRARERAVKRSLIVQGMTGVGAVAGGIIGTYTPVGPAVGAAGGAAAGGMLGTAVAQNQVQDEEPKEY